MVSRRRQPLSFVGPASLKVLDLIARAPDLYALEMLKSRKGISRGSIYVILGRMERAGYVVSHPAPADDDYHGIPKRLYRITEVGRAVLRAYAVVEMAKRTGNDNNGRDLHR